MIDCPTCLAIRVLESRLMNMDVQIHFPFPTFSNAALMESLKEAVEEGLTRAVGVSNFSKEQVSFPTITDSKM